ncbi:site-specific DNA-methyltransferase [Cardiobacteriales bacterium ML27]|uniref:Site-specific DNA-methyltransferase n=2 Tax=Ostreibacterium oceani TaxID=2654998 RepID=A0A6N7F2Q4_9GAMM|nr:site-specific DNA-methyltransferase [Ostreibacterium oceani]
MAKLTELFQLDQPDLDFGFYRIMQAKSQQVKSFIDKDLLQIIEDAFGQVDEGRKAELAAAVEKAIQTAKDFGAPNPEETEPVKKAKAALDALRDGATAESDVYDHLYRFFERYYDEGDFISRRYYARENAGKAAPFAIPYNGEEVKLHWANADQYYIKTAEYFSNYSFDITQAAEIRKMSDGERVLNGIPEKTLKVHFRIVDASEGEHGNVKAAEEKKRFFILHEENPVEFNDADELVINFEYKALPGGKNDVDADTEKALKEKFGKSLNKGAMPNLAIAAKVIEAASGSEKAKEYLSALGLHAPTDKISNRPLLAKYINQYTARNTCDYFIHKDLSGFLKRELDFYIKNEVMHLDDIENADAPAVENYLAKLKVIRKIATKLIDFLAQLEDFQKKLWLKKKFVTETNYCITLDRIPQELYEEIAANDAQREEWVKLFAIDEIKSDAGGLPGMGSPEYSVPLTTDFLKANDKLVLDTAFFSSDFKAKLIASIEDFDEQCDGLLIHSENFQALNLLQERYREQVKFIYIDPPYNTASTPILYKNEYKHSSWASLMFDRLATSRNLMNKINGIKAVAIDDAEMVNLSQVIEGVYPEYRFSKVTVVHNPKGSITKDFNRVHEYCLFLTKEDDKAAIARTLEENKTPRKMRRWGENSLRTERRLSFYPIYVKDGKIVRVGEVPPDDFHPSGRNVSTDSGEIEIWPIDQDGVERRWNFGLDSIHENLQRVTIQKVDNTLDLFLTHELTVPKTFWNGGEFDAGNYGNTLLINILGSKLFDFPKSIKLVKRCVYLATANSKESVVLDYFGGSGTTAHATIELNKEDDGIRKYVLAEMGAHFNNVLKPRTQKVIYSPDWKNGKPTSRDTGISHCFKYIRLESYEDTLNNLVFDENPVRGKAIESNPSLKEDYMLRYLLNVETRGSQSLLNIDAFADPTAYSLLVKRPGSDEQVTKNIDLIETFNYLLGLRLENMAAPQTFTASFTRKPDPELPEDQHTKLVVDGKIKTINNEQLTMNKNGNTDNCSLSTDHCKIWWFRKLEGWVPADPMNPNNGQKERVLIVWRKLTGNLEEDNLMLDEWFEKYRISTRDFEYDTIYVNGSNNLPNLKKDDENWKVRLIEEEFHKKMWNDEGGMGK